MFTALAKFANINLVFDPAFRDQPISIDLRNVTLADALDALTASTHTFYRVTAPRTITIVPDLPGKRREYEEAIVRTFYLSNADIKEVIDLLRVVIDIRQISPITATNAISIKDTPERIVWRVIEGPSDWIDTTVTFALQRRTISAASALPACAYASSTRCW